VVQKVALMVHMRIRMMPVDPWISIRLPASSPAGTNTSRMTKP